MYGIRNELVTIKFKKLLQMLRISTWEDFGHMLGNYAIHQKDGISSLSDQNNMFSDRQHSLYYM